MYCSTHWIPGTTYSKHGLFSNWLFDDPFLVPESLDSYYPIPFTSTMKEHQTPKSQSLVGSTNEWTYNNYSIRYSIGDGTLCYLPTRWVVIDDHIDPSRNPSRAIRIAVWPLGRLAVTGWAQFPFVDIALGTRLVFQGKERRMREVCFSFHRRDFWIEGGDVGTYPWRSWKLLRKRSMLRLWDVRCCNFM